MMNKTFLILAILLATLFSCTLDHDQIEVVDLRCEYLNNPLGIDVRTPRLSWKMEGSGINIKQKSFRILASSDREKLQEDIGDLWDSDKVSSDQSIQILYQGKALKSRDKVFWKVGVWDQHDKDPIWSEISSWEMGLLDETDWEASWVGKEESHTPIVGQHSPAPYFRKSFMLKEQIEGARAYISGLGYYELYINGNKVGDHVLTPNQTNYDRRQVNSYRNGQLANMSTRVLYETYDISSYLRKGENVLSVVLGNGWYYQTTRIEYMPLYYDSPRFIAQVELEQADNSKQVIVSDASWKTGGGPILGNNLHHGEIYDARLEEMDNVGFDDLDWKTAVLVRAPEGEMRAQISPPDRVVGTINPVTISTPKNGVYLYDFGTMFSGWVKLRIKGNRGDTIKLKFIEDTGNTYEQSDTYILKGGEEEVWEPRFTWHSFRYVEVNSPSIELNLGNLEGKIVHTDVESAGEFESSNALFNRISEDFRKTQLDNMHGGVPTDCPHRERRGYTGDGQIAAQAAIYSLDMKTFYTKWLNDISDAQNKENGYVPNTVPFHSGGGGTPWGSAYVIIPWYMYLYYGDLEILKQHYEGMKHYVDYLSTQTDKEGLIVESELGEWVPPDPCEIPPSFVSSAYYYYDLTLMAKMARAMGKEKEAKAFDKLAVVTKKAFNQRYFDSEKSSYSIGRQGANVFPLAFDLVPKEFVTPVFNTLVDHIEVNTKGHFDTGMMGTPYALEVLTKYGRTDLAYTLMNRRDFPSFGYNIEQGATTLWETWTGKDSHSHPMFGSVAAWFFQGLGGINPDPDHPGFKHIIIKPNIVNELDFVNTTYPSVYGDIQSNWELKDGDLKLMLTIPPNTSASVFVPGYDVEIQHSNNILKEQNEGVAQYEVLSGTYTFISKGIGVRLKTPMLSIPVIDPSGATLFSPDSVSMNIRQYSKGAEIRYTLDGSEPNKNSSLFTDPFSLSNSAVIKAKVFKGGMEPGFTKTEKIVFIDPVQNGLNYQYYNGAWTELPNFTNLKASRKGTVYNVDLNEFDDLDDKFALLYDGEIKIEVAGRYTFDLASNDGSRLYIDGIVLIDFDGQHSFSTKSGAIKLTDGKHKIRLEYFQAGGGKGLELLYEGPGIEKQAISADMLFLK